MKRTWICGVALTSCLVGCRNKHEQCAPAKKAAIDAIDASLQRVDDELERVQEEATALDPARFDAARAALVDDIKLVESELDCKRLGKASAPGLVPVQQALERLEQDNSLGLPQSIRTVVKPVTNLFDANLGLLSGPQPGIETWCGSMRDAIAKMKQDIAPLWEPAKNEVQGQRADANNRLAAVRTEDGLLRDWRMAIAQSKPVTIPATPLDGSELRHSLEAYRSACQ